MNQVSLKLLFLQFLFISAKAQNPSFNPDQATSQDAISSFQPSLALVIAILSIMFSLTFILLLYAKFCHRVSSVHNISPQIQEGSVRSRSHVSGIDKTAIESLPFFRFSSLKGSRDGLECAVCLSKFEDIEILRLLPKCKHAFHIDCIDQWLEKRSTCPLCRQKVSADDLSHLTYSNSFRFLWNQSELREESDIELYIQREEDVQVHGSSRFSIGSSFRKSDKGKKEEELPIRENSDSKSLHRFNHKITISEVMLKNRWSNVSSSDLMFLNSEMLNDASSNRFSSLDSRKEGTSVGTTSVDKNQLKSIKMEMERKRLFESKIKKNDPATSESKQNSEFESRISTSSDKRSMSEIIVHPRFRDELINRSGNRDSFVKEEKMRRLWLPIARKTVQWFANRERRAPQTQSTKQTSNV